MIDLVNSIEDVKAVIKRDFKDALNVKYINRGHEHFVALVDKEFAVRFPRTINVAQKASYADDLLQRFKDSPVLVPRTLYKKSKPLYYVSRYINGKHLLPQEILSFNNNLKEDFANSYASFVANLHDQFNIKEEKSIQAKYGLEKNKQLSWNEYFTKTVLSRTLPTKEQDNIAKEYYIKWSNNKGSLPLVLLHDDLHLENILFLNNVLVGVLDFGDVNIGHPEQEFRQLYKLGDDILNMALQTYNQQTNRSLKPENVKNWAIMTQLASYSERWATNAIGHPAFERACEDLNVWLPKGKWGANLL